VLAAALVAGLAPADFAADELADLRARGAAEGWTFTVGNNAATDRPLEALCGLIVPEDWREGARFTTFAEKYDLPAAFDWRDHDGCTPIRDQGACGSCWAFATVGALECNIRIVDGVSVDLSEQWLVSCNQETEPPVVLEDGEWGCNGGWFAHGYHSGAKTDACGGTGAVLEADFPYEADDLPCDCPYPHPYLMDDWAYVGPEFDVPDVDAIKQAILAYGPVSAAVYVDLAFHQYTGGVFNLSQNETVNHGIVLVGWDDSLGANGAWILRNSWGSGWGDGGHMYIQYGCSNVGLGACYVDYGGLAQTAGPTITVQPQGGPVPQGWTYHLHVAAEGMDALHYEWRRDDVPLGAPDAPDFYIEHARPSDAGVYTCAVSDARGETLTDGAVVQIQGSAPAALPPSLAVLAAACALAGARALRRTRPS